MTQGDILMPSEQDTKKDADKQQGSVTPVEQERTKSETQAGADAAEEKPETAKKLTGDNVNAAFSDAAKCGHEWNLDSGTIQYTTTPGEGLDGLESTSRGAEFTCVKCGARLVLPENQE